MLVPLPIVWSYNCREAYVTGEFNDFGLYELSGNAEKCTVIWVPPGLLFYRFLIDGQYTYDPERPSENIEGEIYNLHYVESLPTPLGNLYHMSIHDIEEMDRRISYDTESQSEDSLSDTSEHAYVRSISNYDFSVRRSEEMPEKLEEQTLGFRGWITQLIRKVL